MRTLEELERHAYITGDTATADLLGDLVERTLDVETLEDKVDHLQDIIYERENT